MDMMKRQTGLQTNDKGSNMARKKTPYLKVVKAPGDIKAVKTTVRKVRRRKFKTIASYVILIALALCGTWLMLQNETYGTARKASSYTKDISDTNSYIQFADGIVRYNRDGVVFLNKKNEEQWIQSTQLQNPIIEVKDDAFAVADSGGNNILVFTKDGLKGEIQTTLPIERIAISNQGIVTAILRNENSPKIISYDATGNILVEQQATFGNTGYPISLEMSDDGTMLAVTYLCTKDGMIQSRVGYYNFGATGKEKADNRVTADQYENMVMADVFFMGNDRSVVVGDTAIEIYSGADTPKRLKEIKVSQEIKSVFHTEKYFGLVMLNQDKSAYELRVYNRSGDAVFSKEFTGEYSNVKMNDKEIIMFEGNRCCIFTMTGILKFQGNLNIDAMEMFQASGINRYYVMSANELRVVYLTK